MDIFGTHNYKHAWRELWNHVHNEMVTRKGDPAGAMAESLMQKMVELHKAHGLDQK